MLNTTLIKPKKFTDSIIGRNVREIIDPLDQLSFFDTLKKVVDENTYGFVTYSIAQTWSFLGLLVKDKTNIFGFELASTPLSNKGHQKQLLLNAARSLITDFKVYHESELVTL